ncbi:MAG: UDP-3-O-acyl-N-acetylglucosamine deacetylase [Deltaproteobacteria bacterium]|nr:UDP-3-O-acyl-N-acetylglucosamine deacetylase [Deltaproteobacteria bacterium]
MPYQRTLKHEISFSGIGLHIGKKVNLTLKPAPPNTGIVFLRTDVPHAEPTRAILANVTDGKLATTIGNNGTGIYTVEHLLASLAGLGIDNVRIELDAPEIPILDGSARPFVTILESASLKYQDALKKYVVIREPIKIQCEDKYIEAYPSDRLIIDYTIDFNHPVISKQTFTFDFSRKTFIESICSARTFCLREEVEALRANGFAQGGSLENAVVVDKDRVLNEEGLRFPDEFVRHKILDFIGDLSLLGHPIIARINVHKSGHFLNHQFLRTVLDQYRNWHLAQIVSSKSTARFQKVRRSEFLRLSA